MSCLSYQEEEGAIKRERERESTVQGRFNQDIFPAENQVFFNKMLSCLCGHKNRYFQQSQDILKLKTLPVLIPGASNTTVL